MTTLSKLNKKSTIHYRVQVLKTFDDGTCELWLSPTLYKSKHRAFVAAEWYTMPITDGFALGQVIRYNVLEYLNELIEKGIEYPNAIYQASQQYKVNHDDLQTEYDNQFGGQA
ncbi:hypothetical protein [Agitococcus lubricus]|nr:hypothetical protein [Agitococcus lubricus]